MEIAFGIIVTVIFLLFIFGPFLRKIFAPLFQRWAMGKMEDSFRKMAGMPTRKEERKARKQASRNANTRYDKKSRTYAGQRSYSATGDYYSVTRWLQIVAEDVEFVEIKEFGSYNDSKVEVTYTLESQIEDVEFIEIKI